MLAPLSWLKKFVDVTLTPKELAERLTEVGIGVEAIKKEENETIFELEVTPNRPDWLSMIGIAREIAAIEGKKIRYPKLNINLTKKPNKTLPLALKTDHSINPRFTGIIIDKIKVKESPQWLKDRLISIGQRPINNIVDITNYVMFELGNPIHAFDYDKIKGHTMRVHQAGGGERFKSVDGVSYILPKDAVVISDSKQIIDLCGIKGGENSGTYKGTKTIFIRVPVEVPTLIRKASQSLGLRSEASSIFERGVNAGGTLDALARCVDLILEVAGGEIASPLFDLKKEDFAPWKLKVRISRIHSLLGVPIDQNKIVSILENLNLTPNLVGKDSLETTVPTYRRDLQIEEDLIEEVARMYGYNKFPKTIPQGQIPTAKIPYYKDYGIDHKIKEILKSSGFSEIYTYSLVSEKDLIDNEVDPAKTLRVDNPVSREYEYLKPTHKINLRKAIKQNLPYTKEVNLFELGKVYKGRHLDEAEEPYYLGLISTSKSYFEIKGVVEYLLDKLNIKKDPTPFIEVLDEGIFFEINYSELLKLARFEKVFKPIPKYPPVIEDLSLVVKEGVKTGSLIEEIKKQSTLISSVSLLDVYQDTRTFHIIYQHKERNLTTEEVGKIRSKTLEVLKKKFGVRIKE